MSGFTIVVVLILVLFASLVIFILQADDDELTAASPHEQPRRSPFSVDEEGTEPLWDDPAAPVEDSMPPLHQSAETVEPTRPPA